MTRAYRVQHSYRSGAYTWAAGDLVDLDDAEAAWVGNDSPGCIAPADAPDADAASTDAVVERAAQPPNDRQAKAPRNRGR